MTEYIYRVDRDIRIRKIQDGIFRARRWKNRSGEDYPHRLLKSLYADLPSTEGLYLICFYTSQQLAEKSLINDFLPRGESHISRCHKESVSTYGFTESWDDGFIVGEAYLFWCQEILTQSNSEFSSAGIPVTHFEVLVQEKWIPLVDYMGKMSSTINQMITPSAGIKNNLPTFKKKAWWKFWS
ncbi:hypothetical protein OI450_05575 [Pectobacterium cacticida]|uniref:Uncharacterized protein n=1 Tax=Pectobacterium cacticida TaxID=69221 RepID=A0ABZ2G8P1_9GAMM|nr:hypothetical protein [Pectobacterium cacticida]UYX07846.1 hypothetical protein OI450_05575 [Pectobacterium cacticida]